MLGPHQVKVTVSEDSFILFAFYAPGNQGIQITRSIIFLIFGNGGVCSWKRKEGRKKTDVSSRGKSFGNFFS